MSITSTVFMFSGQGSQYYHMGRELFERDATFRFWMRHLDAVVSDHTGCSVVHSIYDVARKKSDPFQELSLTHPAIFMVEFSLAQALIERNIIPDCVLGVSMGSFAAAALAGSITPEDAITAVLEQAGAIVSQCREGGMLALIGAGSREIEALLGETCEMAAESSGGHCVVSMPKAHVAPTIAYLRERRIASQRLSVSYAFHSRWIDEANGTFAARMRKISPKPPSLPLACCAEARGLPQIPEGYFWRCVRERIAFLRTILELERRGEHRYVDVGPSGSLATLLKHVLPSLSQHRIAATLTPYAGSIRNIELLQNTVREVARSHACHVVAQLRPSIQ